MEKEMRNASLSSALRPVIIRLKPSASGRGRDSGCPLPTGWPGAVVRPRLPQNVACGFPALRSSEVASQHRDSLQLPVGEIQLWSQQRKLLLNPLETRPPNHPFPTPAAQHFAPVALHGSMDPLQCPKVPGNAVVRIVTAKHLI